VPSRSSPSKRTANASNRVIRGSPLPARDTSIALILLDSNFEIALKEFIVHRNDLFPTTTCTDAKIAQLFKNRTDVINEVTKHVTFPPTLLNKVRHYYGLRNKLIHERAMVGITDPDIANYRATIERVLTILFNLRF